MSEEQRIHSSYKHEKVMYLRCTKDDGLEGLDETCIYEWHFFEECGDIYFSS